MFIGYLFGNCLAFSWHLFGIYLVLVWHLFGICLVFIWHLFDIYLTFIWHFFGIYLAFMWHLFGIYLAFIWPSCGIQSLTPTSPPPIYTRITLNSPDWNRFRHPYLLYRVEIKRWLDLSHAQPHLNTRDLQTLCLQTFVRDYTSTHPSLPYVDDGETRLRILKTMLRLLCDDPHPVDEDCNTTALGDTSALGDTKALINTSALLGQYATVVWRLLLGAIDDAFVPVRSFVLGEGISSCITRCVACVSGDERLTVSKVGTFCESRSHH